MRAKIIIGNWKMNNNLQQTTNFVSQLTNHPGFKAFNGIVGVAPNYTYLAFFKTNKPQKLFLCAQNCHFAESGAFTGETSVKMLVDFAVSYVILGHSERRNPQTFHETNELINQKITVVLQNQTKVILCVGETLAEREQNLTMSVIEHQLTTALQQIPNAEMKNIVIAYEPIWAIGTAKPAAPSEAEKVCAQIRTCIAKLYSNSIADEILIQYGGSVTKDNIALFLNQANIDGALVGNASLEATKFGDLLAQIKSI